MLVLKVVALHVGNVFVFMERLIARMADGLLLPSSGVLLQLCEAMFRLFREILEIFVAMLEKESIFHALRSENSIGRHPEPRPQRRLCVMLIERKKGKKKRPSFS